MGTIYPCYIVTNDPIAKGGVYLLDTCVICIQNRMYYFYLYGASPCSKNTFAYIINYCVSECVSSLSYIYIYVIPI